MSNSGVSGSAAMEAILSQLPSLIAAGQQADAARLAHALLERVPRDEVEARTAQEWATLVAAALSLLGERQARTPVVRISEIGSGRSARTAVDVVTDDMPFLVDSVGMAIADAGLATHALIHPVIAVRRDAAGKLQSLAEGHAEAAVVESLMHFEVDRVADADAAAALKRAVVEALADVRASVGDWQDMRKTMLRIADDLSQRKLPVAAEGVAEAREFLRWAVDDNFTFLGYREYEVASVDGEEVLQAVENSGLGILRGAERAQAARSLRTLVARQLPQSGSMDAIILTKTNARARVHRAGYMDYIGVLRFNEAGVPIAEQRFLGLFTTNAYMARPQDVPLVRRKVEAVLKRSGLRRDAHSGKALRHVLELLPRDELFQADEDDLFDLATSVLALRTRPRARLFVRRDRYGRFYSCLAYVPRESLSSDARDRITNLLSTTLRGKQVDSSVQVSESPVALLHLVIRPQPGEHAEYDVAALERGVAGIVRDWSEELRTALIEAHGDVAGRQLATRYAGLPTSYIETATPRGAAADIALASQLQGDDDIRLSLAPSHRDAATQHFKIFRHGSDISLSEVIPLLENMNLKVLTEQLDELDLGDVHLRIQDIVVQPQTRCAFDVAQIGPAFERAFEQIWRGNAENDAFNKLILGAHLGWRQVAMLRGYCKYLLQTGVPFSQSYMEETLNRYPALSRLLVELFEAGFDPAREAGAVAGADELVAQLRALLPAEVLAKLPGDYLDTLTAARAQPRIGQITAVVSAIKALFEHVASLDEDRILRAYLGVIGATLRTNYFQNARDGKPHAYIAFKFDSSKVPDLPKPRPYREIFVYGARVEGIHLRFGAVARGGLRWSDRREDFRTEVLGLVKAQMVKNTVIVPVGSKGGFFVKRPPAERDALLAEGIACYKMFINGLLDVTDNIVDGKIVPPRDVVRHDADDPYLVVAADKGTAKFSDIANGISAEHGFWLGDAFASGGSVGYDHKGMGITARGGWESVKRHFRALGHDCQSEDFTCVGIGDMSGDVFGNGMLLSRHIRLIAAFDHRHIFIDPNPDAATSFAERERMFMLPRSSWEDYDAKLISRGGGIFPRSAKTVTLSPEARAALGISSDEPLTPTALVSAVLKAPVDLLWNGGIGTYVKAESETNADVGDRANNALRVNGGELRCKVVGEGGNLGCTQKGRIEAARKGVLLNTDFIDNSAGVDTSDHEVNIKILLNDAVQRGELTIERRNSLLAEMTDEVARLVLNDNYRQNQAITLMEHMSAQRIGSNAHFIRTLEAEGMLDRQIEFLPSEAELAERKARHQGMTRPELAVLLSYSKLKLFEQLLHSDVPEDPFLSKELVRYFPEPLQQPYAEHMQRHRLKREIIATAVTNSLVNRMDATFMLRMQEDTGQGPAAIAKAYSAVREIVGSRELWAGIEALDGEVAEGVQIDALLKIWNLQRNLTRWLLNHRGSVLDIAELVGRYGPGVNALRAAFPRVLTANSRADYDVDVEKWQGLGVPEQLAQSLAQIAELDAAFDIIEVAIDSGQAPDRVAAVYFELAHALDINGLRRQIEALPVESRWHAQARGALRDELSSQHCALMRQILAAAPAKEPHPVARWMERDDPALKFTLGMLEEISTQPVDYPIASVALRRIAQLVQAGAKS
ncbi:NAD-glutamate dehydrogenase [Dokdonella sp.]|uniref:NAD-glutamate dehydrogenase n=1 Tax=Dokdonella sp. TaxID=2291710 RepID=UPI0025BC5759|nr:NAD-glutamate dehydrogenase [Dokdonella sp.]MBX3688973.1 NAD-glutamate dehydrogenase [Dokdonella sp.]